MALQFRLVEIHGLREAINADILESTPERTKQVDANGKLGQAVCWSEPEDLYTVHTFDGLSFLVPNANLRLCNMPTIESCGFDACWPCVMDDFFDFAAYVHNALVAQSWCLIQTAKTEYARSSASSAAKRKKFSRPKEEFEVDFLGRRGSGKITDMNPLILSDRGWQDWTIALRRRYLQPLLCHCPYDDRFHELRVSRPHFSYGLAVIREHVRAGRHAAGAA
mmetsp:Transcript_61298/g.131805  ORF Transcript_61298/g.131805 Transcript_61298/m.131805 type:complete len:222 (-) Transcript_61298:34-699(-)